MIAVRKYTENLFNNLIVDLNLKNLCEHVNIDCNQKKVSWNSCLP